MAFPTSSLTNNQVHKEGNRAFVYDSALGVWDQVRETDRTENKILQGEIGGEVTFPAGHIIQFKFNTAAQQTVTTTSTSWQYHTDLDIPITRTAGTKLLIQVMGGVMDGHVGTRTFPIDIARSDGLTWSGTNLSRFGDTNNGISCPQYGTATTRYSVSYGCIDTTSTSSDYTYRPTYRSNDSGDASLQTNNGGTMYMYVMEFVG